MFASSGDSGPPCGVPSTLLRSEEHTSELQSLRQLVCRLLLEKNNKLIMNAPPALDANREHASASLLDPSCLNIFFFNDTATTEIYTLSLHDALPISNDVAGEHPTITFRHQGADHELA